MKTTLPSRFTAIPAQPELACARGAAVDREVQSNAVDALLPVTLGTQRPATVDADGVALAAIQGLNQKLPEEFRRRDAENAELNARLADLENSSPTSTRKETER